MLHFRQFISKFQIINPIKPYTIKRLLSCSTGGHHVLDPNPQSPVWSWNEFDPLEEIIVGRPDYAVIPHPTAEVKACISPKWWDFYSKNGGKYWKDVICPEHWKKLVDEVENLAKVLAAEGVIVKRPDPYDFAQSVKTPTFEATGFYCAMPRDSLLIIGDEIIESPMTWRNRFFEYHSFRPIILDYWRRGAKWTTAPKHTFGDHMFTKDYEIRSESDRSELVKKGIFITTEAEPTFDAADFLRCGKDLFVQRSQVTNLSGIEWVRRQVARHGIKVHQLTFDDPRPMHIDGTLVIPKPGVVIFCPERPCNEVEFFKKAGWKILMCPEPEISPDHPIWCGSKWLVLNMLMLDRNRALVEKDEVGMQKLLASVGIQSIKVPMIHAYGIGGAIHCWTSDIRRRGQLESYF